ncbi:MAG: hypothetical protein Q9168_003379, partial [Polycauliona sp. 1 TL-2023]
MYVVSMRLEYSLVVGVIYFPRLIYLQISAGDAAIHLLVDDSAAKDGSTDITQWPVIYKAVLIDGGKTTGRDAIHACIQRIQSVYTFAPDKNVGTLRFDAVMVTHWDDDHWGGIKDFLQGSILASLGSRSDLQALIAASDAKNDLIQRLNFSVAGFQVPYFKYAEAEPTGPSLFRVKEKKEADSVPKAIPSAKLLTTFYAPYVHDYNSSGSRIGPDTSDSKKTGGKKRSTFIPNHGKGYISGSSSNTLGLAADYSYKIGTSKVKTRSFNFLDTCNLVAFYDDYLGVEVFYNKALPADTSWTTITNPGLLVKAHVLRPSSGPRMFIVAGDQTILGNTPLAQATTLDVPTPPPTTPIVHNNAKSSQLSLHPIMRVVDEAKSTALGHRQTYKFRKGSEQMNCPSIACLVISSTMEAPEAMTAAQEGRSWRLWHYMAGDALWDVEGAIAAWLKAAPGSDPRATFMKLSQSRYAKILMYLHALSLTIKPRRIRVYGFIWPVWMTRLTSHFSTVSFNRPGDVVIETEKTSEAQKVFLALILNLYSAAELTTNPLTEFWTRLAAVPPVVIPTLPINATKIAVAAAKTAATKVYNTDRVNALVLALKDFWVTICGQSLDDMTSDMSPIAPLLSIQAIMDGNTTRLKEWRMSGTNPHEWRVLENDPPTPLPPLGVVNKPPAGPTNVALPSAEQKGKRKAEAGKVLDLPIQHLKTLKLNSGEGAKKQEDEENLDLDVDAEEDYDEEAGYKPGLADPISVSGSELSPMSDDTSDDEELPDAHVEGFVEGKILVQSDAPTAAHANAFTPAGSILQSASNTDESPPMKSLTINPKPTSTSSANPSPRVTAWVQDTVRMTSVALPDEVVAAADAPPPTSASPFYLCGSDFAPFQPSDDQAPLELNNFSDWIASLDNGYVALANGFKQPTSTTTPAADSQIVSANIYPDDEWFQRLHNNGLGIEQITFYGSVDSVARVASLEATVQWGLSTPIKLTFSSKSSKTVSLGTTTPSSARMVTDAISSDYALLSLGLSSDPPPQVTVGQIISFFGFDFFPPASSLGGLSIPGFHGITNSTATIDTSPGSRSSLTFKPDVMYSTWLRLRFIIQDPGFGTTFQTNFSFLGQISLSNMAVVGVKKALCQSGVTGRQLINSQCIIETDITLGGNFGSMSMTAWVVFDFAQTKFVINFHSSYTWSQIQGWLASVLGIPGTESKSLDPSDLLPNSSDATFAVRQVTLTMGNPGSSSGFSIRGASITFELNVYKTVFSLVLDWPGPSINASLWKGIAPSVTTYALVPYVEPFNQYIPIGTPSGEVAFSNFCGNDIATPPDAMRLAPTFYELNLTASYDNAKKLQYRFTGTLQSLPLTSSSSVPKLVLGDLEFVFAHSPTSGYDILLSTSLYLVPRDYPETLASSLDIAVSYVDTGLSKAWQVQGSATNISFATIYNLFDADASDAVMDMLGGLSIPTLEVIWDYSSGGEADLYVSGLLRVGPFGLDLSYQYLHAPTSGQNAWTFYASLGSYKSSEYTLGDLIKKLGADQDILDALADVPFVNNLTIPAAQPARGAPPPVALSISKEPGKETIFWIEIAISTDAGTLSFTYVQFQKARSAARDPNAPSAPTGFKRVIRVALDRLPVVPNVPVVGHIDQPVDAIDYVWVGDSTVDNSTSPAGLRASEINLINSTMTAGNQIPFKNTQSTLQRNSPGNIDAAGSDPLVLIAGHHFMVQANGLVILDHIFGQSGTPTNSSQAVSRFAVAPSSSAATTADSGSTKAPLGKAVGPLNIQNIGLQTKNGNLYLLIDATVALGPLQMTIVGFGVGIPIGSFNLNELKKLRVDDFSIILSGMSVYFNSPPVLISGVFVIDSTPAYEAYKGGLEISMAPYSMLAVGEYQHTFANDLKSVFVFGRFDGPLLTLEFAEISGVEVGFGYNYSLRTPLASDVLNFPLVQGVTTQSDPMTTLTQFSKYVTVEQDSVWFAFGFKMDAIQVLSMDAAAIIQFSASDFKVAIVGIASASMPPRATNRREMFLYVELGVVAALDVTGGSLTCQAQLTPNSFVLYPDCHLVGGFAFCYWFGNSPYAGDWVFTVGGYHPAYKPPSYYPVVPRVGINWNLSNVLTVRGEGYFAITPQVCMGGGRLLATFNAGPIYAHFEAWASFLINFKPFFFEAEIGVSISVGFKCDIGLIHIDIHAHLGADLMLSGPSFGGVVHVDLHIHNFSIYFGDQNNKPGPLDWPGFLELVRQSRPTSSVGLASSSSALIVNALVSGSATDQVASSTQRTSDMWAVRAGAVSFRVECKFPIDDMSWGDGIKQQGWKQSVQNTPQDVNSPPIYARPMQLTQPCYSLLTVNIIPPVPAVDAAHDTDKPWIVEPYTKNLPDALWTKYNSSLDPLATSSSNKNNISTLLNPSTTQSSSHLTGFLFTAPAPTLPTTMLPQFNAHDAMSEGVFQDGTPPSNLPPRNRPLLPSNPNNIDERPHLPPTPSLQT